MSTRRGIRLVLATAAVALGVSMAGAGGATAASSWTDFGSGTGIHAVSFVYDGSTAYSSLMSRSGSGIVEEWFSPDTVGGHGLYLQFKPVTYGAWTTPFKMSSSSLGLLAPGTLWTYEAAKYTPTGVLSAYFPLDGQKYWLSRYELSSYATGDITYKVGSDLVRHVTFDVQTAAPGFAATGWMTYDDGTVTYTVDVTAVYVSGSTVVFSGHYPVDSTTSWMVLKATSTAGVLTWAGDVVTTDPSATLSTFVPTVIGTDVAGTITVYTR